MAVIHRFDKVIKRNGAIVDFDVERVSESIYRAAVEVGGRDRDLARLVANEVIFLLNKTLAETNSDSDKTFPSTEEIQDLIEKTLIERGHARTAKEFILHRNRRQSLDITKAQSKAQIVNTVPYQKIWNILVWNLNHQCENLQKLNTIVKDAEKFNELVLNSERAYEDDVTAASEKILQKGDIRLVIVAGPSSSGKTTTTTKLGQHLAEHGKKLKIITVDNYYHDLELHPRDKFGDYDFETPQAIDLPLFNQHLTELIIGKEVNTPIYDFKSGIRKRDVIPLKLEKDEIILLDSLHGLFPDLTEGINENQKFRLYIETLAQQQDSDHRFVRWYDIRLLRRMIRDMQHRGYAPEETLTHWHYVRRSEMQYIFPHISSGTIDHIINGALPYELPVQKTLLGHHFPEWANKYKNDDERQDAYIRAERVANLFAEIEPATQDEIDAIPKDALIREFIGGSSLDLH